jgi:hypothetical protein
MRTGKQMSFKQDSPVWVWDSTWLPAIVVQPTRIGWMLVRLDHGVTFSATILDLAARDPACRGADIPSASMHSLSIVGRQPRDLNHEDRPIPPRTSPDLTPDGQPPSRLLNWSRRAVSMAVRR